MPTEYTAQIKEGINFYQYALGCSRAFGALTSMRGAAADAPIPETIVPDSYHRDRLITLGAEFNKWLSVSTPECIHLARKHYDECVASDLKYRNEAKDLKRLYQKMLAQIESYDPPTEDHVSFKQFMQSQIHNSMTSDCYCLERKETVHKLMSGEEFRQLQIDMTLESLERAAREYRAEVARAENRTLWLKALHKSLEPYKKNPDKIILNTPAIPAEYIKMTVVAEKNASEMPATLEEALKSVHGVIETEKFSRLYNLDGSLKK